jgi:hypothetical protein
VNSTHHDTKQKTYGQAEEVHSAHRTQSSLSLVDRKNLAGNVDRSCALFAGRIGRD